MVRPPLPWGMRNDHAGPANAMVHRIFRGIWAGDGAAALLALLESDEPIDQHVRAALIDALRHGLEHNANALRLEFTRPKGGQVNWETSIDGEYVEQEIADTYAALTKAGVGRGDAFQAIIDLGLANSDRKIEAAISAAKKRPYKITPGAI